MQLWHAQSSMLVPLSAVCYTVWDVAVAEVSEKNCADKLEYLRCWIRLILTYVANSRRSKKIKISEGLFAPVVFKTCYQMLSATKAFHLYQYPYWVCLFQSPICFVLCPFQFVYIWPLLERDSPLIYCPPLPQSAVKTSQGPPVFRPCSNIEPSGCWLLYRTQAKEKSCPSVTRKKSRPHEGLRDGISTM